MSNRISRVLIVGLDGADWRILWPLLNRGELPTLARLIAAGQAGPLTSTVRPESSVAWSSFATGVNPGRHGVFGFTRFEPVSKRFFLTNGDDVRARRFWEILSDHGRLVRVLNVPYTFPPRPVNGYLVSGMLTPGMHVSFAHPPALQQEIVQRFGDYCFEPAGIREGSAALAAAIARCTEQQRELILSLIGRDGWDCFIAVFTGPDRLQHYFWPPAGEVELDVLTEHFRFLDRTLARLLAAVPESTLVLVMSDHGFNGVERRFYINRWLYQQGMLVTRPTSPHDTILTSALSALKRIPLIRQLKRLIVPYNWGPSAFERNQFSQIIDWTSTRVFFAPDGGLRINIPGPDRLSEARYARVYEQLRNDLQHRLSALHDDKTGRLVINYVLPREELYQGPYVPEAPDLIVEPHRLNPESEANFIIDGTLENISGPVFGDAAPYRANHAPEGILIASGTGVSSGVFSSGPRIIDLAPTVLAALNVPIPGEMDGRVLHELFKPDVINNVLYSDVSTTLPAAGTQSRLDPEDEETVAERLRGLGYLN